MVLAHFGANSANTEKVLKKVVQKWGYIDSKMHFDRWQGWVYIFSHLPIRGSHQNRVLEVTGPIVAEYSFGAFDKGISTGVFMSTSGSSRFSLKDLITSSLGKKYFMGVSGIIWSGFLLVHMAGNLLLLVSADLYNSYAHAIESNKPLLYATEALLIGTFLVHFALAIRLTVENRRARPVRYLVSPSRAKGSSLAVRTAILSGLTLAIFLVLHILTFKYGPYYETSINGVVMRDLHKLVVETFTNPMQVGWYVVALVLLGMHLSHGVSAVFQSLGAMDDRTRCWQKCLGYGFGGIVSLGFIVQPVCLYLWNKGGQ